MIYIIAVSIQPFTRPYACTSLETSCIESRLPRNGSIMRYQLPTKEAFIADAGVESVYPRVFVSVICLHCSYLLYVHTIAQTRS